MFARRCPKCKKQLRYTTKSSRDSAEKRICHCNSCANKGENNPRYGISGYWQGKKRPSLGAQLRGRKRSLKARKYMSEAGKGRKLSTEHRKNISESRKGKKHSVETCRKMRLSAIERIKRNKGQLSPNYNPKACRIIEEYGKQHGYNFQHAENGGEFHVKVLGYFVDGYDEERNVVIEYYENWHQKQIQKDKQRQQEITKHLNCTFIRIVE